MDKPIIKRADVAVEECVVCGTPCNELNQQGKCPLCCTLSGHEMRLIILLREIRDELRTLVKRGP